MDYVFYVLYHNTAWVNYYSRGLTIRKTLTENHNHSKKCRMWQRKNNLLHNSPYFIAYGFFTGIYIPLRHDLCFLKNHSLGNINNNNSNYYKNNYYWIELLNRILLNRMMMMILSGLHTHCGAQCGLELRTDWDQDVSWDQELDT